MKNVLLIASLIFNGYFALKLWTIGPKIKYVTESKTDVVKTKSAALKKEIPIKNKIVKTKKAPKKPQERIKEEKSLTEEEKSVLVQEKYDSLQRDFHKAFENFTYDELRLSESQVLFYNDLKSERQKEIQDYLTPKWEELKKKGEDIEYYVYSSEDLIFIGKINDKYLSALRSEWGSDAFDRYQSFLSQYNNAQITNGNDIKFMIDF